MITEPSPEAQQFERLRCIALMAATLEAGDRAHKVRLTDSAHEYVDRAVALFDTAEDRSTPRAAAPVLPPPPILGTVMLVIHEDRHNDTEVFAFAERFTAIAWAKNRAEGFDRFGELDESLTDSMKKDGWLYSGIIGEEGGHVYVIPANVR